MKRKKRSKQSENIQEFPAIGFRVGPEEYGLRLTSVQEIVNKPHITRVPKAPSHISGVMNLHGNVVPIIDVAKRFKIGDTERNERSRVVVVEVHGEACGLLAEGVSKVVRFKDQDIQPPPPLVAGIAAEYLDGVVRTQDRFLIFLNLAKTLAESDYAKESDEK